MSSSNDRARPRVAPRWAEPLGHLSAQFAALEHRMRVAAMRLTPMGADESQIYLGHLGLEDVWHIVRRLLKLRLGETVTISKLSKKLEGQGGIIWLRNQVAHGQWFRTFPGGNEDMNFSLGVHTKTRLTLDVPTIRQRVEHVIGRLVGLQEAAENSMRDAGILLPVYDDFTDSWNK